jgi:hypothetical protein
MIQHPEWYIKILDWSFYVAWGGVAIIQNVAIENTSSVGYQDIKVRVNYYSTTGSNYGIQVGQEIGFLPVTLPPKSKKHLSKRWRNIRTRLHKFKSRSYRGFKCGSFDSVKSDVQSRCLILV